MFFSVMKGNMRMVQWGHPNMFAQEICLPSCRQTLGGIYLLALFVLTLDIHLASQELPVEVVMYSCQTWPKRS
ncbi:MAG: hypothetical protein SFU86_18915 [Pirellulaceae bacterium]|nr:hypothetical protein [Pirellulaceae bacterium]